MSVCVGGGGHCPAPSALRVMRNNKIETPSKSPEEASDLHPFHDPEENQQNWTAAYKLPYPSPMVASAQCLPWDLAGERTWGLAIPHPAPEPHTYSLVNEIQHKT